MSGHFEQELFSILRLVVIFGFILLVVWLGRLPGRRSRQQETEDTQTIQELYRGFERMEARVEALETLLMDRERKDGRS